MDASTLELVIKAIKEETPQFHWWDNCDIVAARSIDNAGTFAILTEALKNNKCLYEHTNKGNLNISIDKFLEEIDKLGGRYVRRTLTNGKHKRKNRFEEDSSGLIIVWPDTIMSLALSEDWIYLQASSLNKELVEKISIISEKHLTQKTQGKAYVFVSGEAGPELRQVAGAAGVELERDNYTPEVLKDFDHIVKDLANAEPDGKLILISGKPGLGKTFLVRGITQAVENAMFVLVPPSMITDIMSPQLIPVLMDHHNTNDGPIVLIMEDGDAMLVPRQADNISSISSLLNLGDGIFGSLLDLRVIITTNANDLDIDKAILRKGRCCKHLKMDALPSEQAEKIFRRLVKDLKRRLGPGSHSLGDIYNAAHSLIDDEEIGPVAKAKRDTIGF